MNLRLLLLLACFAPAARLSADPGPMLYPRGPAAESPSAASPPAPFGLTASALIVLVGAGGGFLWWRRLRRPGSSAGNEQKLAISETRSLGNRQFLVVAAYGSRKFLLGVCPGRVDLLAPLDDANPPASR